MAIIILFNGFKTILTFVITILIHFLKHTSYCKTDNILMWTNIQMHMSSPNGGFFIHVPCFCLVVWFYFGFNVIIYTPYFLVVFLSAQQLAELEKLEKDNRDKNRKFERKNADLTQTNKRLESRNKLLLDEINALVRRLPQ